MVTCTFENGSQNSLRHVVTDTIIYDKQKGIVLVRRGPGLTRAGKFTVPGGYLDRDEDTKQAALREMKEETGYDGKLLYLFHVNDFPNRAKEDRQNVNFTYVAEVIGGEPKINSEATEISWFPLDQLPPEEEFAFDHRETLVKFAHYLQSPFALPIFGKISL